MNSPITPRTAPPAAGITVYFDGGCPVCSREIATYQRLRGAEACAWVDITQAGRAALGDDLDPARAMARLHVRRADGTLVDGAPAFTALWLALPATRWLGLLASVPPLPWLLERAYRLFLRLRPWWRSAPQADRMG